MKPIQVSKEIRQKLIGSIQEYFQQERDEFISEFQAENFLSYVLDEMGPVIYNQAIQDACQLMTEKVEELYTLEKKPR